ncbi:hypothetical protein AVEN_123466-1 [Araneus ventricosus]|uniref:Uncharacterized protein n=1 Tax=Araneus ventricosus TaxID=182803 RepID=A0A4Y2UV72_ARAVE|nr:hypothetical protein AVEN_123466-1 [Araneus ventricosus]
MSPVNHYFVLSLLTTTDHPRLTLGYGDKVLTSSSEGSRFETRFQRRTTAKASLVQVKAVRIKCPSTVVARKFGEGVPAQVSTLSSTAVQNYDVCPKVSLV